MINNLIRILCFIILCFSLSSCYLFNNRNLSKNPDDVMSTVKVYDVNLDGDYIQVWVYDSKERISGDRWIHRSGYLKTIEIFPIETEQIER